jgi:FMN reductase
MSPMTVVALVGNPRPESRTHRLARTLAAELAANVPAAEVVEVDLARVGARVLVSDDPEVSRAVEAVLEADALVVASPTYKATYSGLLKAFLDRLGTGALGGTPAVPILLGGAPTHTLAVDVHFTPLLLELGAMVPARGLFVLESEVEEFARRAAAWATAHAGAVLGRNSALTR